jgi:putative endonuclease
MKITGDRFENAASELICQQGLRIIARNFSAKTGEIDIIAMDGNTLVFIEVRARSNPYFLSAAASVDRRKQRRIVRTAQVFLQRNRQWSNLPCRFDVVAFEPRQSTFEESGHWIRSAFTS